MTSARAPSATDLAATAAATIRQLNHHTLDPAALTGPADLDQIVAELAAMARRLPQLLRQLATWLQNEQNAGRIRADHTPDPVPTISHAATHFTRAGHLANELGRTLDDAHQHTAHLGRTEPERSTNAQRPALPSADDWAETVATSGQIRGHQRAGFMAASGQISMSLDNRLLRSVLRPGLDARRRVPTRWGAPNHPPVPGCEPRSLRRTCSG